MSLFSIFKRKPQVTRRRFSALYTAELVSVSLGFRPLLADYTFETVTIEDVKAAAKAAFRPWKAEKWDCDNQALATLVELMEQGYHDTTRTAQPAAGVMQADVDGRRHAFIWWMDIAGIARAFDQTTGFEIPADSIKNPARL